jgi:CRP/FNR family nitrogen fixation transcriptional regulator
MQTALATSAAPAHPKTGFTPGIAPIRPQVERTLGSTAMFAKDEEVFTEGDTATRFYQVVSGAVRTYKLLSDGRRQIDAFHLPGDMFGIEMGDKYRFSAEAVCGTTIVAYRRCGLESLAANDGAFARCVVTAMMQSLERAQSHMLLLGRKSAVEKVATFLLNMADRLAAEGSVDLPMSRVDMADHLGLTIETVSRSLTQLERENVIELPAHRRSIVLRNRAVLRRLDA